MEGSGSDRRKVGPPRKPNEVGCVGERDGAERRLWRKERPRTSAACEASKPEAKRVRMAVRTWDPEVKLKARKEK